jgi:hypothetical protein
MKNIKLSKQLILLVFNHFRLVFSWISKLESNARLNANLLHWKIHIFVFVPLLVPFRIIPIPHTIALGKEGHKQNMKVILQLGEG